MTKQELNKMTPEAFAAYAGGVLVEGWMHDWYPSLCDGVAWCKKCDYRNPNGFEDNLPCPVADPLDINDWNTAMEMFRGVEQDTVLSDAIREVYPYKVQLYRNNPHHNRGESLRVAEWFRDKATPRKILEICVLAKESLDNGSE
ncbi:hypothetical protein KAR91_57495 [Candidatus Pacearchaeota archaeon]|nr:hypothetical protein [Candidatus Pacearchaeota archaeon]